MIRTLLATTALASVIATGAYAQDAATTAETTAPAKVEASADANATATAAQSGNYLRNLSADQYLASELNGKTIYASDAEDAESIGEIENFLVGSDGKVVAAVVDATVNDESRRVAIPFDQISWSMTDEDDVRAVLSAGADQLAQAPEFTMPDEQQAAATDAGMSGDAMGTGTASTPQTETAAAPAAPVAADDAAETNTMAAGSATSETASQPVETAAAGQGEYPSTVGADQYLSENLIGASVYSGPGEDAESLGDIGDLVVSSSGQVEAGVVGVGGFLGIGEKDVAVPFDRLEMTRADGDEVRIVASATREELEQASSFEDERPSEMTAENEGEMTPTAEAPTDEPTERVADAAETTEQPADNMAATDGVVTATGTAAGTGMAANSTAENDTTASVGGSSERSQMTPVTDSAQLTADNLMGTTVYGPDDSTVGDIGDIALNAEGSVDAVIVDVGGFLGIGEKPVAVAMDNLQFMQDANGSMYLYTQFTEEQLENAPEYNADTYAENRETMRIQNGGMMGNDASTSEAPAVAN
ncbi:PRC-barrel domain-containing protein [Aurantimonas coralicida]|uniref:PRC-barrel domain-containing protein n=1 Tax=Aurantimonas coralicida TaxID=182270 RepID=UPI001E33F9E9|nr:PRC-barrel domain-containing protein [Aurantimonas coralicida]MCD1641446.1 PRC-barrel domain-containing protein [Aurantimonas coralicida]